MNPYMLSKDTNVIDLYTQPDNEIARQDIFNDINKKAKNFSLNQSQNQCLRLMLDLLMSISKNPSLKITQSCTNSAMLDIITQISNQQRLSFSQIQAVVLEFLTNIDNLLDNGMQNINELTINNIQQTKTLSKQMQISKNNNSSKVLINMKEYSSQSEQSQDPMEDDSSSSSDDENNSQQTNKNESLNQSFQKEDAQLLLQDVIDYGYQVVNTKYKSNLFDELISMLYNECLLETDLTMRYQILSYIRHVMGIKNIDNDLQQLYLQEINCSTIQDIFTFANNIEFDLNIQNIEKLLATLEYNSHVPIGYLGLNIPINSLSDDIPHLLFSNIDYRLVIYNFQRPFIAIQNVNTKQAFITSLIADNRINQMLHEQQQSQNQESNNGDLFNVIILFDESNKIKFYSKLMLKGLTIRGDPNIQVQYPKILQSLNISYSFMHKVYKCKNLINLCVTYSKFDIQSILKFLKLKKVYFQHCDFQNMSESNSFFDNFCNCKQLEYILIKQCIQLNSLTLNFPLRNLRLLSIAYKIEKPENILTFDVSKVQSESIEVVHITYGTIEFTNGQLSKSVLVESTNLNYEHQLKLFKLRL